MKYSIIAVFCLVACISAAPLKDQPKKDTKAAKKQYIDTSSYGTPDYSQQTYSDPAGSYNTGASYSDPYGYGATNTGYGGYNTGYNQVTQEPHEDLFNRPVELVAVKNLNIHDGKIRPPTEII